MTQVQAAIIRHSDLPNQIQLILKPLAAFLITLRKILCSLKCAPQKKLMRTRYASTTSSTLLTITSWILWNNIEPKNVNSDKVVLNWENHIMKWGNQGYLAKFLKALLAVNSQIFLWSLSNLADHQLWIW